MGEAIRQSWLRWLVFVGIAYAVIGVTFALPPNHVMSWRRAAWLASGALYAAHFAQEHFRLRNSPLTIAAHVGSAVAIGGFGLAVAATVHSLFVAPNYDRSRFVVALIVWPLIIGVPAFVVAFVIALVMRILRPNISRV
jgi:hypothetical protein